VIRWPPEASVKSEPTEVPVSVRNSVLATTSGTPAVSEYQRPEISARPDHAGLPA
jgi:hypothetical protein